MYSDYLKTFGPLVLAGDDIVVFRINALKNIKLLLQKFLKLQVTTLPLPSTQKIPIPKAGTLQSQLMSLISLLINSYRQQAHHGHAA